MVDYDLEALILIGLYSGRVRVLVIKTHHMLVWSVYTIGLQVLVCEMWHPVTGQFGTNKLPLGTAYQGWLSHGIGIL